MEQQCGWRGRGLRWRQRATMAGRCGRGEDGWYLDGVESVLEAFDAGRVTALVRAGDIL
jgi:hypothetical protein